MKLSRCALCSARIDWTVRAGRFGPYDPVPAVVGRRDDATTILRWVPHVETCPVLPTLPAITFDLQLVPVAPPPPGEPTRPRARDVPW